MLDDLEGPAVGEADNGQAHQSLARAFWVGKGDFAAAIPEFERAIELNPEAGYSYLQLGLLLAWEGQYERAEEVCRRAVELQDQYISGNAGIVLTRDRIYERSRAAEPPLDLRSVQHLRTEERAGGEARKEADRQSERDPGRADREDPRIDDAGCGDGCVTGGALRAQVAGSVRVAKNSRPAANRLKGVVN